MMTVYEELASAGVRLAEAGVETARLDAELLLGHLLRKNRGWLWAHPEYRLSVVEQHAFEELLRRRLQREPLAYLLGEWEFYGRSFHVSPAVLVPRPETELLVEAVITWARRRHATRVADIGTGSGAIAVTLAAEMPEAQLFAVDLSPDALAVARRNAERHGVAARITFLHGDLLAPLRDGVLGPLDVIAANLPYIAEEDYAGLMPEVRDYEPALALRAPEQGLALIRRLIAESPPLLACPGLLALEVGMGQSEKVVSLLQADLWRDVRVITDYGGILRHVLAESPLS